MAIATEALVRHEDATGDTRQAVRKLAVTRSHALRLQPLEPNFSAITQRQQQMWSGGDFRRIGSTITIVAELLCETLDLRAGERVLDAAAGTGNAAIAAARRRCHVVASDYVPSFLETAQVRAYHEGLEIKVKVADVQNLPFEDGSFDVVLSTFGAMFAPDQQRTADELLRVCRPGGRIGMANWRPDGLVGDISRAMAAHLPTPAVLRSPLEWGREDRLRQLFGERITSLNIVKREFIHRYHSPEDMLDCFRAFGPTRAAFESLDKPRQEALAWDLLEVYRQHNSSGDHTLVAPASYIEAVASKR